MPFLSPLLSFFGTGLGKVALWGLAATAALVVFLSYRAALIDKGIAEQRATDIAATAATQVKAATDGAAAVAADARRQIAAAQATADALQEIANAPPPEPVVVTVTVPGAPAPAPVCRAPVALFDAWGLRVTPGSGSGVGKAPAGTVGLRPGTAAP